MHTITSPPVNMTAIVFLTLCFWNEEEEKSEDRHQRGNQKRKNKGTNNDIKNTIQKTKDRTPINMLTPSEIFIVSAIFVLWGKTFIIKCW